MIADNPLIAFIPTQDADRARTFYEQQLGLRFISDDTFAIVMDANGNMVRIGSIGEVCRGGVGVTGTFMYDLCVGSCCVTVVAATACGW